MNIIYYYPDELILNGDKGSQIRPQSILEAFFAEGHNVFVISGSSKDRKKKIKSLKKQINSGKTYQLCYGESTNQTFFLSNKNHIPVFFVDISFFRFLKSQRIPSGIFYRDAYWCFNNLRPKTNPIYFVKYFFHKIEWKIFTKYFSVIFLPSSKLIEVLPTTKYNFQNIQLPPGHNDQVLSKKNPGKNLRLLYVGGIKPPYYDINDLLNNSLDRSVQITICTRKSEWDLYKKNYKYINNNIKIVHKNGKGLEKLYHSSDLFVDIRKGSDYFNMAMPIKYFEAIGFEKPIICFSGSEVSDFIDENQIGWVIKSPNELNTLINHIIRNKDEIMQKEEKIKKLKEYHSWKYRTKQIINALTE